MSRNKHRNRPRKRDYDPISDKYTLTDRELANLALGSMANAELGAVNAARVHKLAASGRSARDIVLITGLSRATVYRALRRLDTEQPAQSEPEHDKAQRAMDEYRAALVRREARETLRAAQVARVRELVAAGHSASDIMLITGLGQAAVYRMLPRVGSDPANELLDPLLL